MKKNPLELMIEKALIPPPVDCPFQVGQMVRVLKSVVNDGVTPEFWAGSDAEIVSFSHRKGEWCFSLRHQNGEQDRFFASELDFRYVKSRRTKILRE